MIIGELEASGAVRRMWEPRPELNGGHGQLGNTYDRMRPGRLVWDHKFVVWPRNGVLPCLSLRGPSVPNAHNTDRGTKRDHGCCKELPLAVLGDARPWGAPQ